VGGKGLVKKKLVIFMLIPALLAGCAGLLPREKRTTQSPWNSFEKSRESFDRITPYKTSTEELNSLGFDPFKTPNVKILTYLDIVRLFIPNETIKKEDLDKGIQECIKQRENCKAYAVDLQNLNSRRYGNFWKDFLQFERKTRETGWSFNALIVILDETVVYKLWGGEPIIHREEETKKPLGPLQNMEVIKPRPIAP
jgi:hypothetical protein